MSDIAIRVEGLGKRYRIGKRQASYGTLRDSLAETFTSPFRRLRRNGHGGLRSAVDGPSNDSIWALKNVSFDVRRGEVVGIIGRNGAGKSTLLKVLARITEPTEGEVDIHGRVGSLLEVGTGFHPELTGRENIFLNGAILGMKRKELDNKLDEIVEFAEVEQFLDTPVKHYSSGMYLRLAFAVAAHLETEILLVDEVLAVGDAAFQKKCLGKMGDVAREGRTVLFVSHSMQAVTTLCQRAILFDGGMKVTDGVSHDSVDEYLRTLATNSQEMVWSGDCGNEDLRLKLARIVGGVGGIFSTDEEVRVQIVAEVLQPLIGLVYAVEVYSTRRQLLAYSAHDDSKTPPPVEIQPGTFAWEIVIPGNTFASGTYELLLDIGIHNTKKLVNERIGFSIQFENTRGIGRRYQSAWTHCFRPNWLWRRMSADEIAVASRSETVNLGSSAHER